MREADSSKLLIPWIENLCDKELYPELIRWVDKSNKIFFISWIHKASHNWDAPKSDVFKKWAEYKGKLKAGKEDRDYKAAFRNALRSKKEILRAVEKQKHYCHWQILDELIKKPKKEVANSKATNNKRKPKQKKGSKERRQPQSEMSFQEPLPSSSSSSVYNEEGYSSPLPPCQTLFHVSPPSTPLQQTDVIFTDIETLEIPASTDSISEPIFRIPTPHVHSSPQSPAQMSVREPLGILSPNVYFNPHSPAQTSNIFSVHETRHSPCYSPISVPNPTPVWMSPEQQVPARFNMDDSWNIVPNMELPQLNHHHSKQNHAQKYQAPFYHVTNEELVAPLSPIDFFETWVQIEQSSLSPEPKLPEPVISQESQPKVLLFDSLDGDDYLDSAMRYDPVELEEFVDLNFQSDFTLL